MSKAKRAKKSSAESWHSIWTAYQKQFPGAFSPGAVVDWAIKNEFADLPKVNPKSALVRELKRAAREVKITDAQHCEVREMLPAKVPCFDGSGQMYLEVVYDHVHTMSVDHALLAFDQRDDNIRKQQKSASRDLHSFLDNNPNAKGHEPQFVFDFLEEEAAPRTPELVAETPAKRKRSPR